VLTCVRADDGHVAWRSSLDVADAFDGEARAELLARLGSVDADDAAYRAKRSEYSALQREVRRGTDPSAAARLEALARETASLKAKVDAMAPYRTSVPKALVGYGTPTPTTDGARIWALSGHGVLAAVDLSGRRLWTRWLGPAVEPMRGFEVGHASSPQLVGGVLIVPYGHLRGVDPATGRDLWVSTATWDHYGTPAVGTIGGLAVVVTPSGEVVRASDGKVLASGLGQLYYTGPSLVGDVVWFSGNGKDAERDITAPAASAFRLVRQGDGIAVTKLWSTTLDGHGRVVSAPLKVGDRLWVVEDGGVIWVLDAGTGKVLSRSVLEVVGPHPVMPSPVLAGGKVWVTTEYGTTFALSPDAAGGFTVAAENRLEDMRATPWFDGRRVYLRGNGRLWCVGG
jgi:hypothetical protein